MPDPRSIHPKEECEFCNRQISVLYMTTHRRTQHGVYQRRPQKAPYRRPSRMGGELVPVQAPQSVEPEWEEVPEGYVLLRRRNGKFYVAQEIRFGDK